MVAITHCGDSGYWLVTITCKDRSKLLFDTVCTLADLDYDVYHATIDSNDGVAQQEYYVKPRLGRTGEAQPEQQGAQQKPLRMWCVCRLPRSVRLPCRAGQG